MDVDGEKLFEITHKLYSMTFVLLGYCENYEQKIPEFGKILTFLQILHETSEELFDLV
jgi:hypothetical protein